MGLVDGYVAGGFNLLDLQVARGGATFLTGGIAMVAVYPEARGSGVGSAMMNFAIDWMRSEGYQLGSLYGFAERYYRRFDYEACGGKIRFTAPIDAMPRFRSTLPVRRLAGVEAVTECYEAFARSRSGLGLRNEFWWERATRDAMIYGCGSPIEAYAVVRYKTGFHDELEVSELVWRSERGYEAMLGFIGDLAVNRSTVSWREPFDSPFLSRYLPRASQVTMKVEGPVMFRAIDVVSALSALRPGATGEFSLEVRDGLCPENCGPWLVAFSPSSISVVPTSAADLSMDVRTFTQALLGQPSLADGIRNGFVEVRDTVAAEAALQLLPATPVMLLDFF